jgi:hypothetical protein
MTTVINCITNWVALIYVDHEGKYYVTQLDIADK